MRRTPNTSRASSPPSRRPAPTAGMAAHAATFDLYDWWIFRTGPQGDFHELAAKLHKADLDANQKPGGKPFGRAEVSYRHRTTPVKAPRHLPRRARCGSRLPATDPGSRGRRSERRHRRGSDRALPSHRHLGRPCRGHGAALRRSVLRCECRRHAGRRWLDRPAAQGSPAARSRRTWRLERDRVAGSNRRRRSRESGGSGHRARPHQSCRVRGRGQPFAVAAPTAGGSRRPSRRACAGAWPGSSRRPARRCWMRSPDGHRG